MLLPMGFSDFISQSSVHAAKKKKVLPLSILYDRDLRLDNIWTTKDQNHFTLDCETYIPFKVCVQIKMLKAFTLLTSQAINYYPILH